VPILILGLAAAVSTEGSSLSPVGAPGAAAAVEAMGAGCVLGMGGVDLEATLSAVSFSSVVMQILGCGSCLRTGQKGTGLGLKTF
jgi:hypothetical protein